MGGCRLKKDRFRLKLVVPVLFSILVIVTFLNYTRKSPIELEVSHSTSTESIESDSGKPSLDIIKKVKEKISSQDEESEEEPYIIECKNDAPKWHDLDFTEEESERLQSELNKQIELLRESEDLDDQLVYALSAKGLKTENIVKILKNILENEPNHELANWNLLNICVGHADSKNSICEKELAEDLIEANRHNAMVWLNVLTKKNANENIDETIHALSQIISAPVFEEYYSEHIDLYDRVMTRNNSMTSLQRSIAAIGFAAANPLPSFARLTRFCSTYSKERNDILTLCLQVGKRMSNSSRTTLTKAIGDSLQKTSYQILGDEESAVEVEKTHINNQIWGNEQLHKAINLQKYDSQLSEQWYRNLISYGEMKAFDILIEDAIRLSADENYNPCPES